jgi:hypothetical protein
MEIRAHDWTPRPRIEWRTAMEEYVGLDVSMKETMSRSVEQVNGSGAASAHLIPALSPSSSASGRAIRETRGIRDRTAVGCQ